MATTKIERHVVLVSPEIHWNTGNIGRSCIGTGAFLHLIKPVGFSLQSREIKRAGLDYWKNVDLTLWDDFDAFLKKMQPQENESVVFTKTGKNVLWDLPFSKRLFLIFGSETRGLPEHIRSKFGEELTYHIPISRDIRSLNLSTAVGIALYESLRDTEAFHGWS